LLLHLLLNWLPCWRHWSWCGVKNAFGVCSALQEVNLCEDFLTNCMEQELFLGCW
jgi:hypothetical protein